MTILSPEACRAARAILNWSIKDLSIKSQVTPAAINQLESGLVISPSNAENIISAFASHKVEILSKNGTGARLINATEPIPQKQICVTIIDNFNKHDRNDRFEICGFENADQAMVYGLRRVRSSVEQFRKSDQTKEQHHRNWLAMGEEVSVDGVYIGMVNFDHFFENPPQGDDCDYISLSPKKPDEL